MIDIEKLRKAKKVKRLTFDEIAEQAGVGVSTVQIPLTASKNGLRRPFFSCFFGVSRGVFESLPPICPHYFFIKNFPFLLSFRSHAGRKFLFFLQEKSQNFFQKTLDKCQCIW